MKYTICEQDWDPKKKQRVIDRSKGIDKGAHCVCFLIEVDTPIGPQEFFNRVHGFVKPVTAMVANPRATEEGQPAEIEQTVSVPIDLDNAAEITAAVAQYCRDNYGHLERPVPPPAEITALLGATREVLL